MIVLQVGNFVDTISLGSTLVLAIGALAGIISVVYGSKWKANASAASATIKLWEQNAAGERERADRLSEDKAALIKLANDLEATITDLRKRPDLELLAHRFDVSETNSKQAVELLSKQIEAHEIRAQERHDSSMQVAQRMVELLTKEAA